MALPTSSLNYGPRCHNKFPRSGVVSRAVAAPTRPLKSAVPEVLDGRLMDNNIKFQEYTEATQFFNKLKGEASNLEQLLHQMNAFEATLDDNILAPPPPPAVGEAAARQAKRAAKRAERRAMGGAETVAREPANVADPPAAAGVKVGTQTTASTSGQGSSNAVKFQVASSNNVNSSTSPNSNVLKSQVNVKEPPAMSSRSSTSRPTAAGGSEVRHLEDLFKLTMVEPDVPDLRPRDTAAGVAGPSAGPSILRPRKPAPKRALAPAVAPPPLPTAAAAAPLAPGPSSVPFTPSQSPALAAAPAAPAAAPQAPSAALAAPAAPPGRTMQLLDHLLRDAVPSDAEAGTDADDMESFLGAGPSDDDIRALEAEVAALGLPFDEEDEPTHSRGAMEPAGSRQLEASALVARAPAQVSVSPTGPSLLSLLPASAAPGRGAKTRQARRSSRAGGRGAAAAVAEGGADAPGGKAHYGGAKDGTNQFLQRSTSATLLTAEREREVTEVCQDFLFLEKVKRQCQKTLRRPPSTDEVAKAVGMDSRSFCLRYEAGLKAKELLLKSNYRLVVTICRSYIGKGMHVQDLISEGVKGLLRGVEMYDAKKGYRFGTYAHWWIRQAVSRGMAETGRPVRLPTNIIEQLTKLKAITARLSASLNREPTHEELGKAMGVSAARVQQLLESATRASSMEAPIGSDDGTATIKDSVQDERGTADEEFGDQSLQADMDAVMDALTDRESRVLRLRYGLEDGVEWTLDDVGRELGVTRERIRQLEAKALHKLQMKAGDASGKLKDYSNGIQMLENKELAARNSLGTRKT